MKLAAILLALLLGPGLAAAGQRVGCPGTLVPPRSTESPEGWRAWRSGEAMAFPLRDLSFADGPPEERAFLHPFKSTNQQTQRIDTYDFTSSTFRAIWLICQYAGTDIALVRETDLQGKRCQIRYLRKGKQVSIAPDFSCD